eukprot:TRINITY_DN4927_c0_g1_i1.p1 TRINITY_DN4927_c0_g1~~TRINITY_DN4927_c0_g1_i1.p1  ORF type:complete len:378 (+),score=89.42 TRINITY_DN4927_c0_g1_i1:102-1235(+)
MIEGHEKLTQSEVISYSMLSMGLVLTAGLMSGLSIGLFSLDKMTLRVLCRSGDPFEKKCAKLILPVVENQHHLMVTLLLCNAMAMEALPIYLDKLVTSHAMAIFISVICIFLFGEIIPQALCVRYSLVIGAYTSWLVTLLKYVTFPVSWTLGRFLDRLLGHKHNSTYTRDQLKELINMHVDTGNGPLSVEESSVIGGILDMKSKSARDCMISLEEIFMISFDDVYDEVMAKKIANDGHSKIPVYRYHNNNIVGILSVKKLIGVPMLTPISQMTLHSIAGVHANKPLSDLMSEFQTGIGMRTVYESETEGTIGIITLSDLMQELREEQLHIDTKSVESDDRTSRWRAKNRNQVDTPRSQRNVPTIVVDSHSPLNPRSV